MPYVVPLAVQYTVHGLSAGRPIANVLAYKVDTTGSSLARAGAIQTHCEIILNHWHTDILPTLCAAYSAQSVSWVDLDSASGSVGSVSTTLAHTWPSAGTVLDSTMPGNVAVLIRKNVGSARGSRKGRMFLPAVSESYTQNPNINTLYSAYITSITAAINAFFTGTQFTGPAGTSYSASMGVTHVLTRGAPPAGAKPGTLGPPLTGELHNVIGLSLDPTLATQRRRLRK